MSYHRTRLLARVGWCSFLNAIRYDRQSRRRWIGQLIGLGTLVFIIGLAARFVFDVASQRLGASFQGIVFQALAFFTLLGMLMIIREAMDLMMRRAYQDPDIPLLMTSPLSPASIFAYKLTQVMLSNIPGLCVWLLPPWLVMAYLLHAAWGFYVVLLPVLLLLLINIVTSVGITLLLIMRFFISPRVLRILKTVGMTCGFLVGLAVALFFVARNAQKEAFFQTVMQATNAIPQSRPDFWVAKILVSFMPAIQSDFWPATGYLIATSTLLPLLTLFLASKIYHAGWELSHTIQSKNHPIRENPSRRSKTVMKWSDRWRGKRTTIMLKDACALRYNPQYILMSGLLTGIAIMTIFLVASQPATDQGKEIFSDRFPPLLFQMIIYSLIIAVPLTIHAFRTEADTWWLMQSLPIDAKTLFVTKLIFAAAVTCSYACLCVSLGMLLLRIPILYWLIVLAGVSLVVATMVTVNLAVGTLPWFAEIQGVRQRNPVARVTVILATLLLNIVLLGGPFALIAVVWEKEPTIPWLNSLSVSTVKLLTLGFIVAFLTCILAGAYRFGQRSLTRLLIL